MADEKKSPALTNPQNQAEADEAIKKAREEAVKEADNPPQPWPTQEQLDKQKREGGPIDGDEDGDDAPKKAEQAKTEKAAEPAKPASGYTTR